MIYNVVVVCTCKKVSCRQTAWIVTDDKDKIKSIVDDNLNKLGGWDSWVIVDIEEMNDKVLSWWKDSN